MSRPVPTDPPDIAPPASAAPTDAERIVILQLSLANYQTRVDALESALVAKTLADLAGEGVCLNREPKVDEHTHAASLRRLLPLVIARRNNLDERVSALFRIVDDIELALRECVGASWLYVGDDGVVRCERCRGEWPTRGLCTCLSEARAAREYELAHGVERVSEMEVARG